VTVIRAVLGHLTPVLAYGLLQTMAPGQARAQDRLPSAAALTPMLDSLEEVALTADNLDRRVTAVLAISGPGRWWKLTGAEEPPSEILYPGIVERLVRVYRGNPQHYGIHYAIVGLMSQQAERGAAAAFLEEVAATERTDDSQTFLQNHALSGLLYLGPPGRAALRRLYANGTVRDPIARATLEEFASRGFRPRGHLREREKRKRP
jgi:hypothetical protein